MKLDRTQLTGSQDDQRVSGFPRTRMRRNRRYPWSRRLVAENTLTVDDFIWPVFVRDGNGVIEPVESMPGANRYSVDQIANAVAQASELGIPAVALFPFTDASLKDSEGS